MAAVGFERIDQFGEDKDISYYRMSDEMYKLHEGHLYVSPYKENVDQVQRVMQIGEAHLEADPARGQSQINYTDFYSQHIISAFPDPQKLLALPQVKGESLYLRDDKKMDIYPFFNTLKEMREKNLSLARSEFIVEDLQRIQRKEGVVIARIGDYSDFGPGDVPGVIKFMIFREAQGVLTIGRHRDYNFYSYGLPSSDYLKRLIKGKPCGHPLYKPEQEFDFFTNSTIKIFGKKFVKGKKSTIVLVNPKRSKEFFNWWDDYYYKGRPSFIPLR